MLDGEASSPPLFTHVGHQGHKPCALDCSGDRMLAGRGATRLATADNLAVTVDQLAEKFNVLVIDIHWARTLAIHKQRISFGRTGTGLCFCSLAGSNTQLNHSYKKARNPPDDSRVDGPLSKKIYGMQDALRKLRSNGLLQPVFQISCETALNNRRAAPADGSAVAENPKKPSPTAPPPQAELNPLAPNFSTFLRVT